MSDITDDHAHFMQQALIEAQKAVALGVVPVGAIVVVEGKIIARAHNEVEQRGDATAHAEMLAVQHASETLSDWRLNTAVLYVTLEPCTMCIGAMLLSRVKELYFGCADPAQGAVGSLFNLADLSGLPHKIEVRSGIYSKESETLLKDFFAKARKGRATS